MSRCSTCGGAEGARNLATERFEEAPVQPDYETSACVVVDAAVGCADAGATGGPRGLGCECCVPGEIRSSPGRAAQCSEWRVLRNCEGQPLSERDHWNR